MERWLLSQVTGRIIRSQDVQRGASPVQFARANFANLVRKGLVPREVSISNEVADAPVAVAQLWQGGWVVPCPWSGEMAEAHSVPVAHAGLGLEYGDPETPLFLCCSCYNQLVGGRLIRVRYPRSWATIEEELLKRPDGRTRGWVPGETVADLRVETASLKEIGE